ncbi:MAG TPA: hypothetical protein VLI92_02120 [Candidatus Saccharimonadales bacterium]|nr:hypothetical protein [Candidatus Saccharimonadales bacterium]
MAVYTIDGRAVEIKAERVTPSNDRDPAVTVTFRVITGTYDQLLTVTLFPNVPENRIAIMPEQDPQAFQQQTQVTFSKLKALLLRLVGMAAA